MVSLGLTGCDEIRTEESSWYRQVRSGTFKQIPFSHDLTLLGYQGWSYVGKLPLAHRRADVVHVQLWHEVYDGAIEPDLLISHKPKKNERTGSWTAKQRAIREVRMDVLLIRRMENGLPKYTYRTVVNGIKRSAELEVPEGGRFELNLIPPTAGTFRMNQPLLIGEAIIEGYTHKKGGKTSYTMNRRLFRWFASFETAHADD